MSSHDAGVPASPARLVTQRQIVAIGMSFVLLAALMVYFLVALWPEKAADEKSKEVVWENSATLFKITFTLRFETRLLLLVVVSSALGSYVHSATSFATYVGNENLYTSWIWWYILRTPIGIALALLFYFVLRGGLLSAGAGGESLSPFGVAALSGLAGMFSKNATDKLRELFENLFRTTPGKGDAERKNKLEETPPTSAIRESEPKS
jgi:hypothetical protein